MTFSSYYSCCCYSYYYYYYYQEHQQRRLQTALKRLRTLAKYKYGSVDNLFQVVSSSSSSSGSGSGGGVVLIAGKLQIFILPLQR